MDPLMLKEDRMHGDPGYPASLYQMSYKAHQPMLELHWHEEFEFLMITQGTASMRVGVEDYEVKAGEAIFVNSGELHSGSILGEEDCSFLALVFHSNLVHSAVPDTIQQQYLLAIMEQRLRLPVHLRADSSEHQLLLSRIAELLRLHERCPPMYELSAKGLICLLLADLLRLGTEGQLGAPPSPPVKSYKVQRLKAVIEYIHTHYAQPIRLSDLAAVVSMNEAYFCRFFKEMTRTTPVDYINQYRLQHAAAMIRATDKKMTEIAMDVGFNNVSYFIEVFKRYFGCPPTAFKKLQHETAESGR
ncbi:AraC family transcriptional regulator [Paenibacillus sp. SYP-B4298]|uniref:AraC family transcriptional regulator n=1 Tax=Paenibacillus sp. SYP-B4298 TaxID=2996034 RepID=UPI0022DD8476|nr:AraC family transcriptional regulator [Paenibacillus sp. SYP-B4298]